MNGSISQQRGVTWLKRGRIQGLRKKKMQSEEFKHIFDDNKINVLLLGTSGAGKSTLINEVPELKWFGLIDYKPKGLHKGFQWKFGRKI